MADDGAGIMNPLVTVYLVNHNYGQYLEKAISSVLNQTFEHYELIIIDDGSIDNSREVINAFVEHEKIIPIYQHNKGLSVTNNIALRAARGKYIMRLDADDYLDVNALMVLTDVLERNQDVCMVFPDYFIVNQAGCVIDIVHRHDFDDVTLLDKPAHGACTLVRKDCLLELGGYDEAFKCQDGYDIWLRFIKRYHVTNVNLPLFYYRKHASNLTNNEHTILKTRTKIIRKKAEQSESHVEAIAIIPVRGACIDRDSQALRTLGKKTLIDWTIEAALNAHKIKHVIVSTPDDAVLAYVRGRYADRIMLVKREARLALLNHAVNDSLLHALEEYEMIFHEPNAFVMLNIESPFREGSHIDCALDMMNIYETDSVVGVRPETDAYFRHNGGGLVPLREGKLLRLEAEELYREVGQMYTVKTAFFKKHATVTGGKIGHVVLDRLAALRLSSEWDWEIADVKAKDILLQKNDKEKKPSVSST